MEAQDTDGADPLPDDRPPPLVQDEARDGAERIATAIREAGRRPVWQMYLPLVTTAMASLGIILVICQIGQTERALELSRDGLTEMRTQLKHSTEALEISEAGLLETRKAVASQRSAERPFLQIQPVSFEPSTRDIPLDVKNTGSVPGRIVYSIHQGWINGDDAFEPIEVRIGSHVAVVYPDESAHIHSPRIAPDKWARIVEGTADLRMVSCIVYVSTDPGDDRAWEAEVFWDTRGRMPRSFWWARRDERLLTAGVRPCDLNQPLLMEWKLRVPVR